MSRSGIIPIAHSQDTAGPMARSVRDAAILLEAMTGTDPNDPATLEFAGAETKFTTNLTADGLAGKRIGVLRSFHGAGTNPDVEDIFSAAIEVIKSGGAEIVDDLEIDTTDMGSAETEVLLYEFKTDLGSYLESSGAPVQSLADVISFNEAHADEVMPIFGQDRMTRAQEKGPLTEAEYLQALKESKRIARSGIDGILEEHQLDALIAPTNGPAWLTDHINGDSYNISSSSLPAVSGYPNVTVPAGFVSGLPIGLSFFGTANSEKILIEIAHSFEQLSEIRRPPEL